MYSDRQTLANRLDADQIPRNAASGQGLHCLHVIPQFYTHSPAVKWTCSREVQGKELGCEYLG